MSGKEIPEIEGMIQAGLSEDEIRRIGSKPTGAAFLSERLEDVDTLADPELQESIRMMVDEPEALVDITPISDEAFEEKLRELGMPEQFIPGAVISISPTARKIYFDPTGVELASMPALVSDLTDEEIESGR